MWFGRAGSRFYRKAHRSFIKRRHVPPQLWKSWKSSWSDYAEANSATSEKLHTAWKNLLKENQYFEFSPYYLARHRSRWYSTNHQRSDHGSEAVSNATATPKEGNAPVEPVKRILTMEEPYKIDLITLQKVPLNEAKDVSDSVLEVQPKSTPDKTLIEMAGSESAFSAVSEDQLADTASEEPLSQSPECSAGISDRVANAQRLAQSSLHEDSIERKEGLQREQDMKRLATRQNVQAKTREFVELSVKDIDISPVTFDKGSLGDFTAEIMKSDGIDTKTAESLNSFVETLLEPEVANKSELDDKAKLPLNTAVADAASAGPPYVVGGPLYATKVRSEEQGEIISTFSDASKTSRYAAETGSLKIEPRSVTPNPVVDRARESNETVFLEAEPLPEVSSEGSVANSRETAESSTNEEVLQDKQEESTARVEIIETESTRNVDQSTEEKIVSVTEKDIVQNFHSEQTKSIETETNVVNEASVMADNAVRENATADTDTLASEEAAATNVATELDAEAIVMANEEPKEKGAKSKMKEPIIVEPIEFTTAEQIEILESDVSDLLGRSEDVIENISRLEEELSRLDDEVMSLKRDDGMTNENDDQPFTYDDFAENFTEHFSEYIAPHESQMENLQTQVSQVMNLLKAQGKIEKTEKKKIVEEENALKKLTSRIEQHSTSQSELVDKITKYSTALEDLTSKVANIETSIPSGEKGKPLSVSSDLEEKVEAMSQQIDGYPAKYKKLEATFSGMESLRMRIDKLEQLMTKQTQQSEKSSARLHQDSQQLSNLNSSVTVLKQRLSDITITSEKQVAAIATKLLAEDAAFAKKVMANLLAAGKSEPLKATSPPPPPTFEVHRAPPPPPRIVDNSVAIAIDATKSGENAEKWVEILLLTPSVNKVNIIVSSTYARQFSEPGIGALATTIGHLSVSEVRFVRRLTEQGWVLTTVVHSSGSLIFERRAKSMSQPIRGFFGIIIGTIMVLGVTSMGLAAAILTLDFNQTMEVGAEEATKR
ncbi:uncharacterized protein V1518DRAFT_416111 [Limtongia smithiae]|uniref:uncharacterized protein n=1 Tax=Limtongia smithiae TaxID=1125753 RepID=UPI0034CDE3E5